MTKPRRTPRLKPSRNLTRNPLSIADLRALSRAILRVLSIADRRVLEGEWRARNALKLEEIAQIKEEIARLEGGRA